VKSAVEIAESRKSSAMYAGRPYVLLERGWIAFRSTNWIPVVTGFVEPVLFLLAFGYGMGNLVGDVTTGNTTIDYTLFIAPGLLANSAMNGAIYDSTWNVFWKLNESKLYKTMLSTPLGPLDIALLTWLLNCGHSSRPNTELLGNFGNPSSILGCLWLCLFRNGDYFVLQDLSADGLHQFCVATNDAVFRFTLPNLGLPRLVRKNHHGPTTVACN
jgi:hypothetical protein